MCTGVAHHLLLHLHINNVIVFLTCISLPLPGDLHHPGHATLHVHTTGKLGHIFSQVRTCIWLCGCMARSMRREDKWISTCSLLRQNHVEVVTSEEYVYCWPSIIFTVQVWTNKAWAPNGIKTNTCIK